MDSRLQSDIQRLAKQRSGPAALAAQDAPARIQASVSLARDDNQAGAGGSGISSPLTEIGRTLHSTPVTSSDGLLVWYVPDVVTMIDAESRIVELVFAAP